MRHDKTISSDIDPGVCGYIRTLIALEGLTAWQACKLIGVPVKLLDTAAFRESLRLQDFETVK